MFLGRVVTKQKKIDTIDFVDITQDKNSIDDTTPTIIVGKSLAESIYGKENVHIIDKKIRDNVFWTYSKTEKRSEYEVGIGKFNNYIVKSIGKRIRYNFFSIFRNSYSEKKQVIKALTKGKTRRVIYITKSHIYIYSGQDSVMGISLDELSYIGIPREKIVDRIKRNRNNNILFNDSFLSYSMKDKIDRDPVITTFLYYIKSGFFS